MLTSQVRTYKQQLESLRARFNGDTSHLISAMPEECRTSGDSNRKTDLADAAEVMDREITLIANEQLLCDEVEAALERIANGNYGKCCQCFREIPAERLEASARHFGCYLSLRLLIPVSLRMTTKNMDYMS